MIMNLNQRHSFFFLIVKFAVSINFLTHYSYALRLRGKQLILTYPISNVPCCVCGGLVDFRTIAAPLPCCCETYVQCSQGLFLARTVQKPECCVNLILQQMEEEQYPGQYWQGRQQREQNGAGWWGSLKD